MKIVFMEADTLGKDIDLSEFDKFGEVVKYPASEPTENAKRIEDADIIIVNKIPVNEELLKEAKNVKLVCVTATGTNIVDMPYVECGDKCKRVFDHVGGAAHLCTVVLCV